MRRSILCLLALLALATSAATTIPAARAQELVESFYPVRVTGIVLTYLGFGYTAPDGSFVSLAGNQIVSSSLTIDYRPAQGEDINNLFIGMEVPTDGAANLFSVMGSEFTETAPGLFHFDLTTNLFNGTVQDGPFDLATGSLVNGELTFTEGQYLAGSGFRYTVALVPEPSTWTLLAIGGGLGVGLLCRQGRTRYAQRTV